MLKSLFFISLFAMAFDKKEEIDLGTLGKKDGSHYFGTRFESQEDHISDYLFMMENVSTKELAALARPKQKTKELRTKAKKAEMKLLEMLNEN